MVDFSVFKHHWPVGYTHEIPASSDYRVFVNGTEIPVYSCRISAYPFNSFWPGHQRDIRQSTPVSFVNLVTDEAVEIAVEPLTKTAYRKIMLKPYAKKVQPVVKDGKIVFTLKENGSYVLEQDDYFGLLYIFNNKPVPCEDPAKVTYYFDKGIHFPGKITLRSGESVYVDKDAYVYGCIYAENAEDLHIYGNGIFDDGTEERVTRRCYEPFTNGNLKLYDCKNVRVEGIGFTNSAIWCINIFHCFDVVIDGINVFGQWRYNTDGIDVVNSQRITIRNCFVHSFDDTVCIKGIDRYSYESNCDILVENCVFWCDWGRVMELGFESECREYKNITFRNCHVLRGGNAVCDIQNGDCAEIHHITFENISVEMESFYTRIQLQENDNDVYTKQDTTETTNILLFNNPRFREEYAGLFPGDLSQKGQPHFAGIHDIVMRNVEVYCDETLMERNGTKNVRLVVENYIPTTHFGNLVAENISCNGVRLTAEDMYVQTKGIAEDALTIR